jgi:general stress protein 26
MRRIGIETYKILVEIPRASQRELSRMLDSAREEDNLVVREMVFKNANDRRAYNKRVQILKEFEVVKVVDVKLQKDGESYKFVMLNPHLFPAKDKRISRMLWDGY